MATQQEIATHLSLSLKGARNMLAKLQLDNNRYSLDEIRKAYIASLDEVGGLRSGELNITNERMKLMQAQRSKIKLETKGIRLDKSATSTTDLSPIKPTDTASKALEQATQEIGLLTDLLSVKVDE